MLELTMELLSSILYPCPRIVNLLVGTWLFHHDYVISPPPNSTTTNFPPLQSSIWLNYSRPFRCKMQVRFDLGGHEGKAGRDDP